MSKPIELIISTKTWLTHATKIRRGTFGCTYPDRNYGVRTNSSQMCVGIECSECPYNAIDNRTELLTVLERSTK